MTSRLAFSAIIILATTLGSGRLLADEPTTPSTPSTTTPSTPSTTTPSTTGTKPATTGVITGKVTKISDTQLTLKVSYQTVTGKTKAHPAGKVHTTTKTVSYEIVDTPPVKIVNGTSRTTGSYADVKVGEMVSLGTGPHIVKTGDGKTTTHTRVTGIDVLKHDGAATTTPPPPSPGSPAKPNP